MAPTATLTNGFEIPLVGFGTWQLRGRSAYDAVLRALDVGYRHIDTATMYGNEAEVGRAVRDSGVPRSELFLTTKLPPERAGRERPTIEASLQALGTDYLDLWLVHWPPGGAAAPATWAEFLRAQHEGLTRSIGVSNYSVAQIDELISHTGVTPAVNQVRWTPWLYDPELSAALRQRNIVLEGYSPFRAGRLDDPALLQVAAAYGVTPTQVVLRWHVEHGFVVIPKSASPARIAENFDVFGFAFGPDDMAQLDGLGSASRR